MGFDILPKNVITGKDSSGKKIELFEYDYGTYAVLQFGNILGILLIGGIFSAISSLIILIMLMIHFNGKFNPVSVTIPLISAFWLYDCHNGWLFSLFLNLFVGTDGLIFLSCMNIACIVVITIMVLFGPSIVRIINWFSNDVPTRYVMFFVAMIILFIIAYNVADNHIDVNWLGLTHIKV